MDSKLKGKVDTLVKSMYKNVQKAKSKDKDAIEDVLDADRIAEISPDDVPASKTGTLKKFWGKDKKDQSAGNNQFTRPSSTPNPNANAPKPSGAKGFGSMLGTPPKQGDKLKFDTSKFNMKRSEEFISDILNKFETISKAYLMEKAKIDDLEPSATKRRAARKERGSASNTKTAKKRIQMRDEKGNAISEWKGTKGQDELKDKLKSKKIKANNDKGVSNQPSKEDLEYPMAASEKSL